MILSSSDSCMYLLDFYHFSDSDLSTAIAFMVLIAAHMIYPCKPGSTHSVSRL